MGSAVYHLGVETPRSVRRLHRLQAGGSEPQSAAALSPVSQRGLNAALQVMFRYSGTDTHGPKLLNRKALNSIIAACRLDRGQFDTELVLRAMRGGKRLVEVPMEYRESRPPRNLMVKKIVESGRLQAIEPSHADGAVRGRCVTTDSRARTFWRKWSRSRFRSKRPNLFSAPQPRSRLYTSVGCYSKGLSATVLALARRSGDRGSSSLVCFPANGSRCRWPASASTSPSSSAFARGRRSSFALYDLRRRQYGAVRRRHSLVRRYRGGRQLQHRRRAVEELLKTESDIGAVLVTHFYGLVCDILPIVAACQKRGIPVVEDAAQAFGGTVEDKPAGTIGDAGVFSFGLFKNVPAFSAAPFSPRAKSSRRDPWRG